VDVYSKAKAEAEKPETRDKIVQKMQEANAKAKSE
jgi:hypothetical protein